MTVLEVDRLFKEFPIRSGLLQRETGRVRCTAEVIHRGGTIATAEAKLTADATGKLLGPAGC